VERSTDHLTPATARLLPSAKLIDTLGQNNVRGQETRAQTELDDAAPAAGDEALIDLLATAVATTGESIADARLSLARRMVIADSLWTN
jgi:hypothetical protein